MGRKLRNKGHRYTDAFKRQMVAESLVNGATVPIICERHGVLSNRIYAWRQDPRYTDGSPEPVEFAAVELTDAPPPEHIAQPLREARIEITLENGRKLSVSNGVDAGFVLELARGLAA